jgi:hypothetical protein
MWESKESVYELIKPPAIKKPRTPPPTAREVVCVQIQYCFSLPCTHPVFQLFLPKLDFMRNGVSVNKLAIICILDMKTWAAVLLAVHNWVMSAWTIGESTRIGSVNEL